MVESGQRSIAALYFVIASLYLRSRNKASPSANDVRAIGSLGPRPTIFFQRRLTFSPLK